MKKERTARGWTLREFSARTGINFSHLGRIENGFRPPTEKVAMACDRVFPERKGYFMELYAEMRTWAPPGFRDWTEHEDKTGTLRDWSPSVVTGLLQTSSYARAILETSLGVTEEIVATRLASRMERQRKLFTREIRAWFVIDEPSLRRLAGSSAVMAGQMDRLLEVAAMPNITLQVLPPVVHPAGASGFVITDTAAYAEHVIGGFVYTEPEKVTAIDLLFDTLRAECYRASESAAVIREVRDSWATGESQLTPMPTVATALRQPVTRGWYAYGIPPIGPE
jgi:hypothetical protein